MLEIGILKNLDSGTYKAGVQLVGSLTTYFDDISVAKNIPSAALVVGNYIILAIPGGNPKDACVIATWPGGSPGGAEVHGNEYHDPDFATESALAAHAALTNPHSATPDATPSRLILRDAGGRAKVAAPSASDDIARKADIDTLTADLITPFTGEVLRQGYFTAPSPFTAKINGAPTATSVVYDTDSNEGSLAAIYTGAGYWGRIVLYNTTRGNSRKIVSVNKTTKTITTESSSDDWADDDDITTHSPVVANNYFDVDLSARVDSDVKAVAIFAMAYDKTETYELQRAVIFHPYEAYNLGKRFYIQPAVAGEIGTLYFIIPVYSQKISMLYRGITGDAFSIVTVKGVIK